TRKAPPRQRGGAFLVCRLLSRDQRPIERTAESRSGGRTNVDAATARRASRACLRRGRDQIFPAPHFPLVGAGCQRKLAAVLTLTGRDAGRVSRNAAPERAVRCGDRQAEPGFGAGT